MKVFAHARHLRMSPRKVRLIADLVRGLDVSSARRQLMVSKKAASDIVLKLLNSAAANAEHNFQLPTDHLRIVSITVDGGPVLYRYRPRAFGRSAPIRKRTSHVTIALEAPESPSTRTTYGK
ncbi:TPA: 50S ribosomal protein L22 [Candidatus Uhrbacteria bacterium]|uniref:Large ribosomal subunit protein uL22 n=1 Tax=Candidatus Uhrbacteria bacterium GW2011_GWC2_53_7 TaxID=1618986 RepID=A0A0G1Y1V6_9BACT|nr:MAG: 50S ribosomal protein L22 [Candidatus Uhrbacteria bacterium GW2011_GWC2_53_7]OGL72191.1 MAG: 50S ribosomal protein L22 [Candidatus Uhrbacteria bacterium RIFCSPHIGHO2_02_FULL_54_11]HBL39425.1 50S ribosomal protein L22 [Candidatus Uhrbacteria bacterium]